MNKSIKSSLILAIIFIQIATTCGQTCVPSSPPGSTSSEIPNTPTDVNGIKVYAYPNPTTDLITVGASNNNYQNVFFTVTDISGRVMAQYNSPTLSGTDIRQIIDASTYAPGLYIVTMTADSQKYSFKFSKE